MKQTTLILIFCLFLTACNSCDKPPRQTIRTVQSETGDITLQVPAGWTVVHSIHENAILQIANQNTDTYLVVIDDEIAPSSIHIEDQALASSTEFIQNLGKVQATEPSKATIAKRPAVVREIKTHFNNLPVIYLHVTLLGRNSYYQMLAWTLEAKADQNMPEVAKIMKSFQENETIAHR